MMENKKTASHGWDIIVIGSGIGGLTCASALAHQGKKVLVLEQHYVAGGMTHTFKRKGFLWDVGVHVLGEMTPDRLPGKLLDWLSDGNIQMESVGEVYDTFYFPDNFKIEFPDNIDQFRANLLEKFPREEKAIDRYFDLVIEASSSAKSHFLGRNMPMWLESITSPLLNRKFKHWSQATTKSVLDSITDNVRLKAVLVSQWGYYGSPPSQSSFFMHAGTVRHFWEGGFYPRGSAKTIAENILPPIESAGGAIQLRTSVADLIMDGNKVLGVRTEKGEEFYASKVVSAIGAKATVGNLLPLNYQRKPWAQNIQGLKQSPCHICHYIGFEGDIESAGATKSNQWFYESWDAEITHWDPDKTETCPIIYASFPSLKDSLHDPGEKMRHTAELVTFVPWEFFSKWDNSNKRTRSEEYQKFKADIDQRLLNQFFKLRPGLKDLCVYSDFSTPLSTTHYCRPTEGAIYGLEATPARFTCRDLRPKLPIKGLYLAGSDVATGGVAGAMIGGFLTAAKIDRGVLGVLKGLKI